LNLIKNYFIKSIISLIVLFILSFTYLKINIKKIELNYELSLLTQENIEIQEKILTLKSEFNKTISNTNLEKYSKDEFNMDLPTNSQIIRIKNESN